MAATQVRDNGPFDPRITSIPFTQNSESGGKKLTRGFIIQEKPTGGVRYRCNFLYNPSVVSLSHSVNPNVVANSDAINPDDVSGQHLLMPLQQQMDFSLLFDRTYELWDKSKLHGEAANWVPNYGVAWDVLTLYKITGIATPMTATGEGADATGSSLEAFSKGQFTNGPSGPMLYVPVYCYIGSTLSYYGVIQSLNVQYTHWTQEMIPIRCRVDISIQMLPLPNKAKSSGVPSKGDPWDDSKVSQPFSKAGKGGR